MRSARSRGCSDSMALRECLGLDMSKPVPEHSPLTMIRQRLPLAVHEAVFARILELAATKACWGARRSR